MIFKKNKKYKDTDIVSLIKKGDTDGVLLYLYRTVQPKITNWIIKNDGDREEAQDIFQDAVVSFYKYVLNNRFKEGKSVEGFIFGIGKNMWINRAKKRRKMSGTLPLHLADETRFESVSDDRSSTITELLAQLGKRCEELLTYSIFYKMTMEDVALRMNFSTADAAKTKNYKCKQRLIKIVKDKSGLKKLLYDE